MAIDLNACIGCNACVVACQAENNIPIVGKEQVLARPRDALDARSTATTPATLDNPDIVLPADAVPAVRERALRTGVPGRGDVAQRRGAERHGLQPLRRARATARTTVPTRCAVSTSCSTRTGTRRRSRWLHNPDVTVRSRGVMEKCTYCVQRINHARIDAKREDRQIRDGEIVTACQQACPAQAIVFGDINDPESRVSKLKKDPRNYGVLAELNTRPRTTYLAAVKNPSQVLGQKNPTPGGEPTTSEHG